MKELIVLAFLLAGMSSVYAQDEDIKYRDQEEFKTIFGGRTIGGYGGLGMGYSIIDDRSAVTFDARGGVILGHSFALGIGGCGFVNTPEYIQADNADISLTGGYGGFFGELILFPRTQVHLSFPVLAGLGAAAVTSWVENPDNYDYQSYVEQTSVFMIVEPAVELEFNLTRFFRMAAYFSYRYTSNLELDAIYAQPDALNNYSVGMRVKFGKF